ncbi:vacuolar membrane-associated protein-like protein IML1 [Hyaloscypha variabilis]
MATVPPLTPRRGNQPSHLRQFSNGSFDFKTSSRPPTAASEAGPVQHDPAPIKLPVERVCILWNHDEGFSKEEVVINLDLFPEVKAGELLGIVALKTDSVVRDFQEKAQASKKEVDTLATAMQRERSNSNPRSPGIVHDNHPKHDVDLGKRYLFIAKDMSKEMKTKQPKLEVSVAKHIADLFCLKHRSSVLITTLDPETSSASHVEMSFKDEYLARSDMWRLAVGDLGNKTVFKGQKILFMGTIKAQVTAVYVSGRKVQSAFFSTSTKPIFRSESARYVLFIQMSREMWDFDSEGSGEIMFNKVVNGFLPALFKKWASLKAKHLVSIVLFTRVEYDTGITSELATSTHDSSYHTGIQTDGNKKPYKDFYRVVVSEMASGSWTTILYQLKREFKFFRKDISLHRIDTIGGTAQAPPQNNMRGALGTRIEAEPSLAMYGNVLEAINLASSQFAHDYIDRDLMRTGISIVVITPSPGLFEVDYETLRMTTEILIGNGIGIDLVCLPKMPLHSVPLFRYRNPQFAAFHEALNYKSLRSEDSTPRQNAPIFGSSFSSLNDSLSPTKASQPERSLRSGSFAAITPPSEWSYAIPHWIDVSFWTGASQELRLANPSTKIPDKISRRMAAKREIDFPVRCKMYEMEMASVIDNVMTEIAVTPLQHDALFPQMTREVLNKTKVDEERLHMLRRRKAFGSLLEFVNGPSKVLMDRNSSQEEKRFYHALDTFDITRSELLEGPPGLRLNNEGKRPFKTGSEEAARKVLAEDPKVFGTSFSDDMAALKGAIFLSGSPGRNKQDTKTTDDVPKSRKDSVASSITANSRSSTSKTPKLGRQISLGKHGFGIAPPKAATAEIQTEHASAAKLTSVNKGLDSRNGTGPVTNHFLTSTTSHALERPSSSQSDRSKMRVETPPESKSATDAVDAEKSARPMTIKSAVQSLDSTNQFKSRSVLGSVYEVTDGQNNGDSAHPLHSLRQDEKLYHSKLLAGSVPELPATLSPTTALSPWLSVLNPSNPSANDALGPGQYRRWQHVFPRPIRANTMKWKSLCCPASVPLTTEFFPTKQQLDTEYQQKPYKIFQNVDDELSEVPRSKEEFLRDLISLRLSQGFQIVVGPAVAAAFGQKSLKIANVFDRDAKTDVGSSVFMSMGNTIHQLSCVNETEIEVNMFIRKPTASTASSPGAVVPTAYNPAIRTTLADQYESRQIILGKPKDDYNWNYVDAFIAGFDEKMSEGLRFWRARFVLIPVERPTQSQRRQGEDNEEEIRLEGIKKLTQMWQKHRVVTASEKRFQTLASRKTKDLNPLDIVYKTEDPSIVVTAELETLPLLETGEAGPRRGLLLETERFRKAKLEIPSLAEAIQSPVERGGVRMQNRRWHFRLHYNCFIGSDMTTWLIENFEDIETREEAVELGNMLMAKDDPQKIKEKENGKEKDMGIFVHVEKRHPFRDGQYFYQVTGEFAKQRPESRSGWFASKRRDTSVPSTPMSESVMRDSPRLERSRSSSNHDEISSDSGGTTTPTTTTGGKRPKVALSKVMKYDVDHRKRSYRPERINLHYDRLHNPDNCYHIRIDWMNVTAKLIEDAIESWALTAERYGLRLVEAPIGEACSITTVHPFRSPYTIELACQPPEQQPRTYFDANSFAPQVQSSPASRHYYQKAIMKKFNFVLDIEAAKNFPSNVDVTYSWGRPDFKYTQYIHRSGVLLAQITDEGNFLLLANRLYNNRTAVARDRDRYVNPDHERNARMPSAIYNHALSDKPSPLNSPVLRPITTTIPVTTKQLSYSPILRATSDVLGSSLAGSKIVNAITPETIKNEVETFCRSASALEAFYKEVLEKATPPSATPPHWRSPYVGSLLDSNIPTLGLPPGVLNRDTSPSPMRLSNVQGVGSSMPHLGRRQSVQVGGSGVMSGGGESPRGSVVEGDKGS